MPKCKVNESGSVMIDCPGCGALHCFSIDKPNGMGSQWSWNGDIEKPTFSPSILVRCDYTTVGKLDDICHSFVSDGKMQFLADCTHSLAGQTVELPEWEHG